jgi:hypothetical protein
VIVHSYAVVDPGTVVVEPFNTSVANRTVFAPRSPKDFAIGAHFAGVYLREDFHELKLRPNEARLLYAGNSEGYGKYER